MGLAVAISVAVAAAAPPAHAICVAGSDSFDSADEAFEGVALEGPVAPDGVLLSPARFRVNRWLRGDGPGVVEIPTAVHAQPGGDVLAINSEGISPRPGERWLIMLRDGSPVCTGSRQLAADESPPSPPDGWRTELVVGVLVLMALVGGAAAIASRRLRARRSESPRVAAENHRQ